MPHIERLPQASLTAWEVESNLKAAFTKVSLSTETVENKYGDLQLTITNPKNQRETVINLTSYELIESDNRMIGNRVLALGNAIGEVEVREVIYGATSNPYGDDKSDDVAKAVIKALKP